MGRGYEFTQNEALKAAQQQLAKLKANSVLTPGDCQVGQMSQDRTQATFPDGTTQTVSPQGQLGDFAIVCNGLAFNPEPTQVSLDSAGGRGLVIGFDKTSNDYYLRRIGGAVKAVIPKTQGTFSLDSRIQVQNRQARLASDGKALLIGGFFQDIPTTIQTASGTGPFDPQQNSSDFNNDIYRTPQPGFTYHTIAQWLVYLNPTIVTDSQGDTTFSFDEGFSGSIDLTSEAQNKLSPPVSQGLGSSAVYRLYPSNADLYVPTQNTPDGTPAFAHARFFPAVLQAFTTQTADYQVLDPPFGPDNVSNWATSGQLQTIWTSDGSSYPLFMGLNQPWGCTPSNLLFVFNRNPTTLGYTVDIVADISLGTAYKIDNDRIQTAFTFNQNQDSSFPGDPRIFSSRCSGGMLVAQAYSYGNDGLYAYLMPFHNIQNDEFIASGITVIPFTGNPIIGQPSNGAFPTIVYFQGGNITSIDGSITQSANGIATATWTDFGPLCPNSDCIYFNITQSGDPGPGQDANNCAGPGLSSGSDVTGPPDTGVFTVTDWDGTSFTINDYGPLLTGGIFGAGAGLSGFFIFLRDGGCNPPSCPGSGFMSVINAFFFLLSGGFADAYRFGRGICAFDRVADYVPDPSGDGTFDIQDNYKGPAITISRLQSPLAQNHLYQVFRSPSTGGTACTYQIADPYVIPDASTQQVITYQNAIDELNNDLAYNGQDVLDSIVQNQVPVPGGSQAFSAFFYASNYIDPGIAVNSSNFVQPPDVMTDQILSPNGTWPFPNMFLKGADSFVVEGYNIKPSTDPAGLPSEIITIYNVDSTGLTSPGKTVTGTLNFPNETVMDYLEVLTFVATVTS